MFFLDIRKYLKSLLGDVAPLAVGLGLGLGVLAGLPPAGPATALVVLLFLVLRANLATFVVGAAVGKAAAFAVNPFLYGLGEGLLETGGLQGLWAWFLNLPIVCLFGWDGYLALGATAVALVVAVVVTVLAVLLLPPLRRSFWALATGSERRRHLAEKGSIRFLVKLLVGKRLGDDDDDTAKQGRVIRRGFVIPAVVFLVVVTLLLQIFGDGLARRGSEIMASQALGKQVGIEGAAASLLGGSLDLRGLLVREPNPGEKKADIADGQRVAFDVSPWHLLGKRVVVDQLSAENMVYHAGTSNMPTMPPEPDPETGAKADLPGVLEFIEAHEKQIRWLLEQLDGSLGGSDAPPAADAPGYEGRAAYVSAARTAPVFLAHKAGVTNLVFDWDEKRGPLTRLKRLDLNVTDLSSNPVRHSAPIALEGSGDYGDGKIKLKGVFDVRQGSQQGHGLDVSLDLGAFGTQGNLGLVGGKGLVLDIATRFDRASHSLAKAVCKGHFTAAGVSAVDFTLGLAGERAFQVGITGLDLATFTGVKRPDGIKLERGLLNLKADFKLSGGALAGTLGLSARNLHLSPGTARTLAGIPADQVCKGLNALSAEKPFELTMQLGGTPGQPSMSLNGTELEKLAAQVKAGLLAAGEKALAGELDKHLGELGKKTGIDTGDLGKKAGGLLGGLLGGDKKKEEKKPAGK